jgi:diphthamide synthase (EF-2-diphthine--ammonia ligase)
VEKKDSCYAMMRATQQGFIPKVLLNMMNENGKVSRSHGLPLSILNQQAKKWIALEGIPATWVIMKSNLLQF